jgi:hypothetical protein
MSVPEIATAISEGASSFLRRQYLFMSLFLIGFAVVLLLALGIGARSDSEQSPSTADGRVSSWSFGARAQPRRRARARRDSHARRRARRVCVHSRRRHVDDQWLYRHERSRRGQQVSVARAISALHCTSRRRLSSLPPLAPAAAPRSSPSAQCAPASAWPSTAAPSWASRWCGAASRPAAPRRPLC